MLKAFVATLKPKEAAAAVVRFETGPGEQMQVDWAVNGGQDRDPGRKPTEIAHDMRRCREMT
jgi:transposase